MFRTLLALGIAAASWGMVGCRPPTGAESGAERGTGSAGRGPLKPEDAWLAKIGVGPAQTARVCKRGARDRAAQVLCAPGATGIHGLSDLYRALGFVEPASRYVASTTHSLALSARIVSAANPRTFVFPPDKAPIPLERFVVTAFARGEQFLELAALDPATLEYNFYLVRFEQDCNATRCTPEDLLTEKIESGWTSFTLYADRDLEDTALDCLSCHLPFGPGTRKQLLMRQTAHPWLHWGDFRGVYEKRICHEHPAPYPGRWIPGEGVDLMARLEGRDGHHAGLPVAELAAAPSGERFSLFLTDAENTIRHSVTRSGYPYAQLDFDARGALCERMATGQSPTWEQARSDSLLHGLPVPFYAEDVLDPVKRQEIARDRAGFLARHAADDAVDLAMSLMSKEASVAIGFLPRADASGKELLHAMCVRCHSASVPVRLKRAKFDAETLDRIQPETAKAIRKRITLPRSSPELMPPLRAGELPAWAIARIDAYLRDHCGAPDPRACD